MSNDLTIGKRYRFTLRSNTRSGWLEGVVRSLSLPAGMLGNRDGEHRIWVAGEQFEWFLRPSEIVGFEELSEASLPVEVSFTAALRSLRPDQPYRGRCLRSGRPPARLVATESHPLLQHLGSRHRRDQ